MTNWFKAEFLKRWYERNLGVQQKTSYLTLQKVFPFLLLRDTSTPGTAPLSKTKNTFERYTTRPYRLVVIKMISNDIQEFT